MKRNLCYLMAAMLAFSICMPTGALQAFAQDSDDMTSAKAAEGLNSPEENDADDQEHAGLEAPADEDGQLADEDEAAGEAAGQADAADSVISDIAQVASLRSPGVELPNVVTNAHVTTSTGTTPVNVGPWQAFKIHFHYVLPNHTVHEGDTTTIELPAGFRSAAPTDFVIKDGDNIIARGKTDPTNTKYILTYTSYAEGKSDISGDFSVNAQIDNDVHTHSGVLPVNPVVSGETVPAGSVNYTVHVETALPIIKSGWANAFDTTKGVWQIKINQDGKEYTDAVLDDTLLTPGVSIIPGTLEVFEGTWQLQGTSYKLVGQTNVTSQYLPQFISTGTTFKLGLGHIPASKGLLVRFQTKISYTPLPGEKFENKGTLTDNGVSKESKAYYLLPTAGGIGEGYNYTINIKKTDEMGAPLAGAVFDIVRTRTGMVVGQVTTNASGEASLSGLLRDSYVIKETTPPSGYLAADDQAVIDTDFPLTTKSVTKTFVDKVAPSTVDVAVEKTWNDNGDQDGIRPSSVKIRLFADGAPTSKIVTLDSAGSWKGSFTGLDQKDASGNDIAYTVEEDPVPLGYISAVTGDATAGYTVTNTHTPATVDVPVVKKWVGPAGSEVTVLLLADGADTGKKLKLDADNNWSGAFSGLPKYDHGREIAYTVKEDPVANYDGAVDGDAASGFTITNTNAETVKVPVEKRWVGPKGSEVTVRLLADGKDAGKELKLNAGNGWKGSFDGLPKYNADGSEIAYTVTEAEVSGVDSSKYGTAVAGDAASGFTITNTNKETVDVSGTKSWDDDSDRDGVRPASITVNLMRDGAKADSRTVTPDASGMWAYAFAGLPKYDPADGHEYAYTVTEEAVPNYATSVDGTDITNSYTPGKTSVTVTKAWADANDQDGIRPSSVKAQLYADGRPLGDPVELSEANSWTHTWTGLFMKEAGKDVAYTVREVSVPKGYEASVAGDAVAGFTIANAHEPETVDVPVAKRWVGGEGSEVTVRLLADGADTGKALKLDAGNNWKGSFDGLPAFKDGKRIAYTVAEDAVEGYSSKVTGDASKGFTVTNTKDEKPKAPAPGGGTTDTTKGKTGSSGSLPKTGDGVAAPLAALLTALAAGSVVLIARRRMS
ncbi:Cna B-type domain-containing protein [Slackia exigua]|uniref:Cna B-type domain-containing protein n=1 Tax=Slackia exigua TaxID=84109 RepID=UPI002005E014|nr:Cna B-type domain-containing protein [Slackia exigua]MCK6138555.1 Cna B-type domain-containing protein [Slackia exigua]